jgi:hypothetical protein
MLFDVLKPPKIHIYICQDISSPPTSDRPTGVHRRAKRARGSAPRHPGRGHVEIRGLPEPSGSGPDLLPHASNLMIDDMSEHKAAYDLEPSWQYEQQ